MMTATEFREAMINAAKDTNELRQSVINLMSKTIVNVKPEVVIRRLQNDEAFAVYANVDSPDAISNVIRNITSNTRRYTVLIAIITQKSNPNYFNSIKNLIRFNDDFDKGVAIPESHHLKNMFHLVFVRDDKGNILEKLIKFNHNEFCNVGTMVVDNYTTTDDVINLISMLYKCAEFIVDDNCMLLNELFFTTKSPYTYFKYGAFLMDNQAAEDEILHKVITDDLYGYQVIYHEDKLIELKNNSQSIMYETGCSNKLCSRNNNDDCNNNYDGCLVDIVLYYTAKSSLDTDKEVHLKGEFAYLLFTYNGETTIANATKRYIIPRTWFDFEKVHYYDAKINNIVYDNCGRSLMCN